MNTINAKYVHVTIQKITDNNLEFWIKVGLNFRQNVDAILVGIESNFEKGLHVHILIQFTTKQKLSRKQFLEHFQHQNINVKTKSSKNDLMMALGYVVKTGKYMQYGEFSYRGVKININFESYRFRYLVYDTESALEYFTKLILESIDTPDVIEKIHKRTDEIGRYLQARPMLRKTLNELEVYHKYEYGKSKFKSISLCGFWHNKDKLRIEYVEYIRKYPGVFERYKGYDQRDVQLEPDYDQYIEKDLEQIMIIMQKIDESNRFQYRRPHKTLNLFIWSSCPSFGKTRLVERLREKTLSFRLPDDEYYVDYQNNVFQVILSDEASNFIKTKDYAHLKKLLAGEPVEFNRKMKDKLVKTDNPLIIMADNNSFDSLMTKHHSKNLYNKTVMQSRILDLEIKGRAALHFIIDRCILD